jgi:hypothetical protein
MKRGLVLMVVLVARSLEVLLCAQTAGPPELDQLKAQIELLKQQQAESQKTLLSLENKIDTMEKAQSAVPAQPSAAPPQAETAMPKHPGITGPASDRAPETQTRAVFSADRDAAARIDNVSIDPDMQGFFRIGDTPTLMRLGGYAKLDVIHDFKLPGDPDAFITSTLPLAPVPVANSTNIHVRQSRFSVELRRPTPVGDLRVLYENDFFGVGPTILNLRHLYGQLRNVLAGWTYSTFMDVDSLPDTLDYQGPGSMIYIFQPQFRYTLPLNKANSLAFGIEKPTTDVRITNPTGASFVAQPTTPIPDFVARYRYEVEKGHLQLATVLRSVGGFAPVETGGTFVSKHVLGWGVNLSGSIKTHKEDSLLFQGAYGNGIGRYIEDLTGLGPDAALNASNQLKATPALGTFIAYEHYWNERWRSTGTYGYTILQREGGQRDTFFHKSNYASANLIWNPAGNFNMGVEYLYGNLHAKNGDKGYGSRLQLSMQYDFYKW